jgi:8-oxo-dGTP pyrophosphatase MutT (NUDIX family)
MKLLIEKRAGGIIFRRQDDKFEYLLVTSNSNKSKWIFPAGHVETGETPQEAALREVLEEAGVIAEIIFDLGNFRYYCYRSNQKIIIETDLYLMKYIKTISEDPEGRQVQFFDFDRILDLNIWKESREFLKKAHLQVQTFLS